MPEPVLCYVRDSVAYFTSKPLADEYADGWGKRPYEHNSSIPWDRDGQGIVEVMFQGDFDEPRERYLNSPYSVMEINAGVVPWLKSPPYASDQIAIWAGVCIPEFKRLVRLGGGKIYVEELA